MDAVKVSEDWIARIRAQEPSMAEVGSILTGRLAALHLMIASDREEEAAAIFNQLVHLGRYLQER